MRTITDEGKLHRGYGTGSGTDYKPYIRGREFNSSGTVSRLNDYITGRPVELLSRGEMHYWYLLRFQPTIVDIQEQYPLELNHTLALADAAGIKHPYSRSRPMTTDFYITYEDGTVEAHSFKASRQLSSRTKEKLYLEHKYWELHDVPYKIVFGTDINVILAENIRICSYHYDESSVFDEISCLKYMIIHRKLDINIADNRLIPGMILPFYKQEVAREWNRIQFKRNAI